MKLSGLFNKKKKKNDDSEESYSQLNLEEKDMIRGVVELSETTVKEVMVPRIDVVFISRDTDIKNLFTVITECGHSRFPVYEETIDNVIGILHVKDLLKYFHLNEIDLDLIIRKPFFVPDSKKLDSLLREFKHKRVHIAVSVDEYGGVSGIVCMEDIIEEIVGEIQDEFDNEEEELMEIGKGEYLCDARANIADINEEFNLALPEDNFDTLGGFVFDLFGKIPVKSEKVQYNKLKFIIQEMDGHKIKTVKIVNTGKPDE